MKEQIKDFKYQPQQCLLPAFGLQHAIPCLTGFCVCLKASPLIVTHWILLEGENAAASQLGYFQVRRSTQIHFHIIIWGIDIVQNPFQPGHKVPPHFFDSKSSWKLHSAIASCTMIMTGSSSPRVHSLCFWIYPKFKGCCQSISLYW